MSSVSRPPEHKIREDIIRKHDWTFKMKQFTRRKLSDDHADRIYHTWFSVFHKLLANIQPIKLTTNLVTYSLAIYLSSQGQLLLASVVGGFGIIASDFLGEFQTAINARKLAYESIDDHKRRERKDRQRNPRLNS